MSKLIFAVSKLAATYCKDHGIHASNTLARQQLEARTHCIVKSQSPEPNWPETAGIDHSEIDTFYQELAPKLYKWVSSITSNSYEYSEWEKIMRMWLYSHTTLCLDAYDEFSHFDPDYHFAQTIHADDEVFAETITEHRAILQYSATGREMLFKEFLSLKYPALTPQSFRVPCPRPTHVTSLSLSRYLRHVRKIAGMDLTHILYRSLRRLITPIIPRKRLQIAWLDAFFSAKNSVDLIFSSRCKISSLNREVRPCQKTRDTNLRKKLPLIDDSTNERLTFTANMLVLLMPVSLLEGLADLRTQSQETLSSYKNLTHIVCEAWTQDESNSVFLVEANRRGIKHIHNEHNYLSHMYDYTYLTRMVDLVDVFYTLGWKSQEKKLNSCIPAGSCFYWPPEQKPGSRNHDEILIVGSAPEQHRPDFSPDRGETGAVRAMNYFGEVSQFFLGLKDELKPHATYRCYPNANAVDDWFDAENNFHRLGATDMKLDFASTPIGNRFLKSRYLAIAYLSTANLESLIANVPMGILFIQANYVSFPGALNHFKPLIDANIMFLSGSEMASHYNTVESYIDDWWYSSTVQDARKKYLEQNLWPASSLKTMLFNQLDPQRTKERFD